MALIWAVFNLIDTVFNYRGITQYAELAKLTGTTVFYTTMPQLKMAATILLAGSTGNGLGLSTSAVAQT